MDLYSAARRFARPFHFPVEGASAEVPIGARGIVGDGTTAALVRVDGAIDWLCFPRFDSPSVFAAILDPERGGLSAVWPVRRPFESLQRYDPDTNVLETLFRVPEEGAVRLVDFMPWTDDPRAAIHEVHRRIECVEGRVEMEVVFDPRFDYGRRIPRFEVGPHGVLAQVGGETLAAALGRDARWRERTGGGLSARFALGAGERCWMVLSWDAPDVSPIEAYRPFDLLRATRQHWRNWSARLRYDGPWRHHVLRSALTLKLLIHAPTGAQVAAPTTSLPEWIGGTRNWDYRYTWMRDSAMAVRAAVLVGFLDDARDYFHFVRETLRRGGTLGVMYAVDGTPVPAEETLRHLRGHRGSRPVRVGNGARGQLQLDTAGALLDAAYVYERAGGALTLRVWRQLRRVANEVTTSWTLPDHGIWEPRDGTRHHVHSKVMSWLALDRAARLALRFGDESASTRWRREAERVREDVLACGLDRDGSRFVSAYGREEADAALLRLPLLGFLDARDPRVARTIDWVRERLGEGPFLRRYRFDDGVGGAEGAFVLCGFWLAEALALMGRLEEAQAVFVAHAEASNHLGLLAEEVDPGSGDLLGNFPQAFSHLGLIEAAARIDLALRRRDEGRREAPRFGLDPGDERAEA